MFWRMVCTFGPLGAPPGGVPLIRTSTRWPDTTKPARRCSQFWCLIQVNARATVTPVGVVKPACRVRKSGRLTHYKRAPMQTLSHEHLDILLNKNARCFQYAMEVENDEYELSLSTGTQH